MIIEASGFGQVMGVSLISFDVSIHLHMEMRQERKRHAMTG
jgi:hypothetical protein